MTVKRVLFIDHTARISGGEIALLNLIRQLDRRAFFPLVILFDDGDFRSLLEEAGIECHVIVLSPDVNNARKDSLGIRSLKLGRVLKTLGFVRKLAGAIRDLD